MLVAGDIVHLHPNSSGHWLVAYVDSTHARFSHYRPDHIHKWHASRGAWSKHGCIKIEGDEYDRLWAEYCMFVLLERSNT